MQSQNFVLCWKEHYGALVSVFENLLQSGTLVDCTLAAEGQYIKAHKVVLSACSSYFQLLFGDDNEKHPIVILKDVKFQDLKSVIDFMYKGEVQICDDRLGAFLEIAQNLQVKGLGIGQNTNETCGKIITESRESCSNENSDLLSKKLLKRNHIDSFQQNSEECTQISFSSDQITSNELSPQHGPKRDAPSPTTVALPSPFSVVSSSCPLIPEVKSEQIDVESSQCSISEVPSFVSIESPTSDTRSIIRNGTFNGLDADSLNDCDEVFKEEKSILCDAGDWLEENSENVIIEDRRNEEYVASSPSLVVSEDLSSSNLVVAQTREHSCSNDLSSSLSKTENSSPDNLVVLANGDNPSSDAGTCEKMITFVLVRKEEWMSGARPKDAAKSNTEAAETNSLSTAEWLSDPPPLMPLKTKRQQIPATPPFPLPHPKRHGCPTCTKTFPTPSHLKIHMRTHTGERPYKCPECDYAGKQKADVRRHRRIHTGERPYKCTECPYAALTACDLQKHRRTHTGERPYLCRTCGSAFAQVGSLRDHESIHTGKRFTCRECGRLFGSRFGIDRHKRRDHGIMPNSTRGGATQR